MTAKNAIFNAQLLTRLISALALLPVVLAAVWYGGYYFSALLAVAFVLMGYEWLQMIKSKGKEKNIAWLLLGLIYIVAPLYAFYLLRLFDAGALLVFWSFLMVWAMDVGGFFAGKAIGGPKMAPKISPNKTWSGLLGGVLLAICASELLFYFIGDIAEVAALGFSPAWYLAGVIAIIAQIGDLVESQFKRHFGIKDTSGIIPGHGGILDRADGLLLAAPTMLFLFHYGLI